jgi:hypothetical protein
MQMTAQQMLRSIALTAALSAVGGIGGAAVRHVSGSDQSAPVLSPAPVARIPFRSLGGLILVPVRINGSRELSMILDTGMSSPVVVLMHRELGDELKLSGGRPVQVGGAGGQVAPEGLLYGGVIATLGGVEQPALTAIVMSESRDASEWVQDGIIGKSVFDRYIADIDYEASVLSLYEPESFEAKGFESVPLSFDHAFPTLEAKVENEAGRTIPVRLVLDLGAGTSRFPPGRCPRSSARGSRARSRVASAGSRACESGPSPCAASSARSPARRVASPARPRARVRMATWAASFSDGSAWSWTILIGGCCWRPGPATIGPSNTTWQGWPCAGRGTGASPSAA